MMMAAIVESPPAAAAVDFAANLHLLADVAIGQDKAEKAAAIDREILSLRRVAAAKLLRETRVLDKFARDMEKKDFLKMAASVMPWTTPLLPAAGHKRKRVTSYSPDPFIIDFQEEEEEKQAEKKKKKKLMIKIKMPSPPTNNNNSPEQSRPEPRVENFFVHRQVRRPEPADMPERFKRRIGELAGPDAVLTEEKFLIEKALTASDTRVQQARLTMPERSMAERELLTEEEECLVRQKKGDKGNQLEGVHTTLIDPNLGRWEMMLKRWDMGKGPGKKSSVSYAINGEWNKVLKAMGWEEGNGVGIVVRVWSLRVNGRLWVAVDQRP